MIGQVLWPAVFAYAVWRFAAVIERWAPPPVALTADKVVLPEDVIAWAMQETETWAQEEHLQVAREKYVALGKDWNRVRSALGIGVIA